MCGHFTWGGPAGTVAVSNDEAEEFGLGRRMALPLPALRRPVRSLRPSLKAAQLARERAPCAVTK